MVGDALAIRSRQMPASFGVQGPGDSTIASGSAADHVGGRDLVVAMHDDVRPQLAQVVDEVEGEAVVVVDQDDHPPGQRFRAVLRGRREGVKRGAAGPEHSPSWPRSAAEKCVLRPCLPPSTASRSDAAISNRLVVVQYQRAACIAPNRSRPGVSTTPRSRVEHQVFAHEGGDDFSENHGLICVERECRAAADIRTQQGCRQCAEVRSTLHVDDLKPGKRQLVRAPRRVDIGDVHRLGHRSRNKVHHESQGRKDIARGVLEPPFGVRQHGRHDHCGIVAHDIEQAVRRCVERAVGRERRDDCYGSWQNGAEKQFDRRSIGFMDGKSNCIWMPFPCTRRFGAQATIAADRERDRSPLVDRVDPGDVFRLLDRFDVEIDHDRLVVAAHQHAFERLVLARVDLLMRHVRRHDR